ncbi:MAG TPA: AAA family ATPase [Gaiellaceae bacterium]|nr:AAA family ATPase [Gaiellaceae bacterium]
MPAAFIGRADELATLRAVLGRVRGAGRAAVVTGDAGGGKTRLLTEALADAGDRRVLHVRGHRTTGGVAPGADDENPAIG